MKKYIIGIDFGHGETSAAYCEIPTDGELPRGVFDIELEKEGEGVADRHSIPSAIFIPSDKNGIKRIGGQAFRRENLGKGKIYVGFKQKPKNPPKNIDETTAMWEFMKEVVKTIRANGKVPVHNDDFYLYIAKPSSWGNKAKERFFELVQSKDYAGLPVEDIHAIINESRAAFIKAQLEIKKKSDIGKDLYKGAVVVDMGSSTVDMTYMSGASTIIMRDHGYDCGAAIIEEAMLEKAKEANERLRSILNDCPEYKYPLLYEYRKAKEIFFSENKNVSTILRLNEILDPNIDKKEKIKIRVSEENIEEYTKEYQGKFRQSLRDYREYLAKKEINQPVEIKYVILTGGASRMKFAKEIISKEWGLDIENGIYQVDNPSLTVSRGIAEVARLDILTKGKKEEIEKKMQEVSGDEYVREIIIPIFLKEICESQRKECNNVLDKEGQSSTLEYLKTRLKNCCNDKIKDRVFIAESLRNAIEKTEKFKETRKDVENLVRYYSSLGIFNTIDLSLLIRLDRLNNELNEQFNSVTEELQKKIGEELNKANWFKRLWRKLFESKIKRIIREKSEYTKGGTQVPTKDQKNELKKKVNEIFDCFPKNHSDLLRNDYTIIKIVKNYNNQYLAELMSNIDRVRKEITEND